MSQEFEAEKIQYGFVDKFYEMNPLSEDLIKGHQLEDGMRVLIADPRFRPDLAYPIYFYTNMAFREGALRWNRWMTVTEFDGDLAESGLVSFIGLYDDGTKKDFILSSLHGWFVKINGVSDEMLEAALVKLRDTDPEDLTTENVHNVPKDVEDFTLGIQQHDPGYKPEQ